MNTQPLVQNIRSADAIPDAVVKRAIEVYSSAESRLCGMRAALTLAPASVMWQPMATAPKDDPGPEILGCDEAGNIRVIKWRSWPLSKPRIDRPDWWLVGLGRNKFRPVMWMALDTLRSIAAALPATPEPASTEGGADA